MNLDQGKKWSVISKSPMSKHEKQNKAVFEQSENNEWINDINILGSFMSLKDNDNLNSLNQNPWFSDINEIAKNADNLIEILQNIKKTVNQNKKGCDIQNNEDNHLNLRYDNEAQLETENNEDATTNPIDRQDKEESKLNVDDGLAPQQQIKGDWW